MTTSAAGVATANQLCAACVDLLGVDGAAISMVFAGEPQGTYGSDSEASRRLDEYQFTFGQGPSLDAAEVGAVVQSPDLDNAQEHRWPLFADAVLDDGIRAVFALPIKLTSSCVGALDLFRVRPGPLTDDELAAGLLAAELAVLPLLTLLGRGPENQDRDEPDAYSATTDEREAEVLPDMDRLEVYQASGMVIAQLGVGPTEALARLRAHAIATGRTATEVARAVLDDGLELERDDDGLEGQRL